jgi:hypothetical protein
MGHERGGIRMQPSPASIPDDDYIDTQKAIGAKTLHPQQQVLHGGTASSRRNRDEKPALDRGRIGGFEAEFSNIGHSRHRDLESIDLRFCICQSSTI